MLGSVDLSHLTAEEQNKILEVLRRQQDEEEKEKKMLRVLQDQFEDYKSRIKSSAEESVTVATNGTEDNDPVCALCFKTKFAEGCGHVCSLCEIRFCSRCGGRITVRSNKTVWICNICRKQKEILAKSGAWYHGKTDTKGGVISPSESELEKENVANKKNFHINNNTKSNTVMTNDASEKTGSTVLQSRNVYTKPDMPNSATAVSSPKTVHVESPSVTTDDFPYSQSESDQSLPTQNTVKGVSVTPQNHGFNGNLSTNGAIEQGKMLPSESQMERKTVHETFYAGQVKESELATASNYRKDNKPSSSIDIPNNHTVRSSITPIEQSTSLQDLNRNGSVTSSDEDVQSTTENSSLCDCEKDTSVSDFEVASSKRSSYFEDSYYRRGHCDQEVHENFYPHKWNGRNGYTIAGTYLEDIRSHDRLPVCWQPSTDGMFLIGHLTLCKNTTLSQGAKSLLGLKVVGGKTTPSGRLGAFITKVRKGSLADTVGHLKPGDEIISWNKYCLQDATFREVYQIIADSKPDPTVELVVSRPIRDTPRIPETRLYQTAESSSCSLDSERRDFDMSTTNYSLGRLQIKLWYDLSSRQLHVTALRAVDLPMRMEGLPRNPYLKMYLLPDRSNSSKRRTKTAKKTLSPEWMQTFVYNDVRKADLGAMALELTLWDLDRSLEANNKFIGEVIVDLGLVCMDDEPHWFRLLPLGRGMEQDYDASSHTNASSSHLETYCETPSKSTTSLCNSTSQRSFQSVTKRRLPTLPTKSNQIPVVSDEENIDRSSTIATEPDIGESASGSLAHSQYGSHYSDQDPTSVDQTLQAFVGGTGPGQVIDRQALAMSPVGEIELSFRHYRGKFILQVKQAFNLACRPGARSIPAFFVKVYMMEGVKRLAKKKTKPTTRSLSPIFNEGLVFDVNPLANMLQVILLADYGRMDSKVFTGAVQISLENCDLTSATVSGRYKLFPSSTIFDPKHGNRQDSSSSFGSSSVLQS